MLDNPTCAYYNESENTERGNDYMSEIELKEEIKDMIDEIDNLHILQCIRTILESILD